MAVLHVNDRRYRVRWRPGMTVQDVIRALRFSYALLLVRINGQVVPREEWPHRTVHLDDDVKIWHMIAE